MTWLTVHRRRQLVDPTKRDNVMTWGRFLELCARFDNSFSEVRFFLPTVSYGAPAGKIFRALGEVLLSKDVKQPFLRRHQKMYLYASTCSTFLVLSA